MDGREIEEARRKVMQLDAQATEHGLIVPGHVLEERAAEEEGLRLAPPNRAARRRKHKHRRGFTR